MPVPNEIAGTGPGGDQGQIRERRVEPGRGGDEAIAHGDGDGFAAGQAIDAVHEIEEIDEPHPGNAHGDALHEEWKRRQDTLIGCQRAKQQGDSQRVGRQPHAGRQPVMVIDPGQDGKRGKGSQQQDVKAFQREALRDRPQDDYGNDHRNAGPGGNSHGVHAALIRQIEPAGCGQRAHVEADQSVSDKCGQDGKNKLAHDVESEAGVAEC